MPSFQRLTISPTSKQAMPKAIWSSPANVVRSER